MILMSSALAIFILLILLSSSIVFIVVNEREESTHFVVGAKARTIAMVGLERGIQQFRHTRIPPVFTNVPLETGNFSVKYEIAKDETGAALPLGNYVMVSSIGKIENVERNLRTVFFSLEQAFMFALYSENLTDRTLDLTGSTVNGTVYYRGNVETTVPVSEGLYAPSGFGTNSGSLIYHPDPQPRFPHIDTKPFLDLIDAAKGSESFNVSGGTIDLSSYANNELYANTINISNAIIVGPGKIISNGPFDLSGVTAADSITFISGGPMTIKKSTQNSKKKSTNNSPVIPSVLGTSVGYPKDGVILYSEGNINIDNSTVYGLGISARELFLDNSIYYGAFLSYGAPQQYGIRLRNSTVVGSPVTKYRIETTNSSISRGTLPLAFNSMIKMAPFVIPGSWLEY